MLPHSFDAIDKAAVDALIANVVREGRSIEYKLELPASTDDAKKEFLADVSSFANAAGGDILYGVDEQREAGKPTGIPSSAPGLAGINLDAEILRLESIVRDGLAPRIAGIRCKPITGFAQGPVLVVRVPTSWRAPHMVTFKGSSRFYSRTSAGKYQLDVTEIRSAFAFSESLPQRVQAFRDERVARIIAGETPVPVLLGGKAILHILPIAALERRIAIDPVVVHEHREQLLPIYTSFSSAARYNIDGLLLSRNDNTKPICASYLQVFRTGAFEAVDTTLLALESGKTPNLTSTLFEQEIIRSTSSYLKGLATLGMAPPFFVMLTLVGVKGFEMAVDQNRWSSPPTRPFDRDTLFLPDIAIEDSSINVKEALKPIFDAMWQGAGWPQSPYYIPRS